jgi:hypothetical protein
MPVKGEVVWGLVPGLLVAEEGPAKDVFNGAGGTPGPVSGTPGPDRRRFCIVHRCANPSSFGAEFHRGDSVAGVGITSWVDDRRVELLSEDERARGASGERKTAPVGK